MNSLDNMNKKTFMEDENNRQVLIMKVISLLSLLAITLLFGYIPLFWKKVKTSTKFLGIANAFSGGIFIGIALFHLLPESNEKFEEFFEINPNDSFNHFPLTYFITFASYALILFIEKVAFDSHSLIAHEHDDGDSQEGQQYVHEEHEHGKTSKDLAEPLIDNNIKPHNHHRNSHDKRMTSHVESRKQGLEQELYLEYNELKDKTNSDRNDTDEDEEAIKNVVSTKGKFATLLQIRNIMQSPHINTKPDRAMQMAGQILSGGKAEDNESIKCMRKISKIEEVKAPEIAHHHHFSPQSNLTPYILLLALSFHGFFEGIALGIQESLKDTIFLFVAITSHKWAEAFSLGISFSKARTEKRVFIQLVLIFSLLTPLGIIIGILFTKSTPFIEGVFLALSAGTFLYISASEVIVEEFAVTKYKYQKYSLFVFGAVMMGILALLELFEE